MTVPTDAERATARWILATQQDRHGAIAKSDIYKVVEAIATALATARAEGWKAGVEDAAVAALCALPRAHTYGSENADVYRAQDDALQVAARKIRALAGPGEREGT